MKARGGDERGSMIEARQDHLTPRKHPRCLHESLLPSAAWTDNPGMTTRSKVGIVLSGYALAFVASCGSMVLYERGFTPEQNQTMGGMIAGGSLMLGTGVLVLVGLVPTGLMLFFMRRSRPFWSAFTGVSLACAMIGLAAVLSPLFIPGGMAKVPDLVGLMSIVQMFGSPLWAAGFALSAAIAPARDLRRRMLAGLAIAVVSGVCGLVHFMLPRPPL